MSLMEQDPLADSCVFGVLNEVDRAYLTERVLRAEVESGQVVICKGMPSDSLLVVLSGEMKIVAYSQDGAEFILGTVRPGETIGEMGILSGRPRSATVVATSPSVVLIVPRSVMMHMIEERPALAFALLQRLVNLVSRLNGLMADLVHLNLAQRVAKFIVQNSEPAGVGDSLATTQTALAASIGASRQRVNACLRSFEKSGWITIGPRRLTVRDRAALTEVVNR